MGSDYLACMNSTRDGIWSAAIALNGAATPYDCEGYRLPTEAEWEYAARAGTTTAYYSGNSDASHLGCEKPFPVLENIAWYCANSNGGTRAAGTKNPNPWGLHDMGGDVWEWAWDWYGAYTGDATDPTGPAATGTRVVRGGSWFADARRCRSASRSGGGPGGHGNDKGFRIARTAE